VDQVKYTIMHIDDSRIEKRNHIRNVLFFYDEVTDIEFVNGADAEQVKRMRERYPNFTGRDVWNPKTGEAGVWYSQMQCWRYAAENEVHLIVFEDDAIPDPKFESLWRALLTELPADYDFLSIFVPNNQTDDYFAVTFYDETGHPIASAGANAEMSGFNFSENLATVYQGYSCVATMFSPKGGRKLLELADHYGMYTPVDCFLFLQAHAGRLDGYAPKPDWLYPRMVTIDWSAPTTVQHTDRIDQNLLVGEV
jgi:GR25 family glycosyltransferase involved in LPS biosynthesis